MGVAKIPNRFELKDDYGICYVRDNDSFIFDKEDYYRISQHHWWRQRNNFYTHINGTSVSLANFIMNTYHSKSRTIKKDPTKQDYRKNNLYAGNTYEDCGDYYIGTDYAGNQFKIDKDDYELCKNYRWYVDGNGYVLGYPIGDKKQVVKQHRLIMGIANSDPSIEVDHIYHDQLDNRKSQLRIVSRSQNIYNTRLQKTNTSGYKGVYKSNYKSNTYWHAQINYQGKRIYLGSFPDFESAVMARKEAEQKYHGEYVCQD